MAVTDHPWGAASSAKTPVVAGAGGHPWRLGLAGAGAFGRFVLTALAPLPDVELAGVSARSDVSRAAALAAWRRAREEAGLAPGAPDATSDLLEQARRADVDVVLVATPPDLQPQVAQAAVEAGKALFLEKPGALSAERLQALAALARERGVAAGMNFVMRANPIINCVRRWYQAGLLGLPERWHVENWAGGELPTDHWFWDPGRSGGVLIEHGVHFFDEAAWVLGARPLRAWGAGWPHPRRTGLPARAMAVVEYEGTAAGRPWHLVASFYHGFVRSADEHQVRELGFTAGWLRIDDWIPRRLTGELRLTPEAVRALEEIARAELTAFGCDPAVRTGAGVAPRGHDPAGRAAAEQAGPVNSSGNRTLAGQAPAGPTLLVLPLGDNRVRVDIHLEGGEPLYREMVRRGFMQLRRAAAGAGEPLAPLEAGANALAVAEAARSESWQDVTTSNRSSASR